LITFNWFFVDLERKDIDLIRAAEDEDDKTAAAPPPAPDIGTDEEC